MDNPSTVDSELTSSGRINPVAFQPTICGTKFRETLKLGSREREGRVLDLGTGTGIIALEMAAQGAKDVVGIDLDPVAIQQAQSRLAESQSGIKFVVGDLFEIPLGRFDLVTLNPPFFPSMPTAAVRAPIRWAFDGGGPTGKEFFLRVIGIIPRLLANGGRFVWGMPAFWEPTIKKEFAQYGFSVKLLNTFPIDCFDYSQTLSNYGFNPAEMLGALADCEEWRITHQQAIEEWIRQGTLQMAIAEAHR